MVPTHVGVSRAVLVRRTRGGKPIAAAELYAEWQKLGRKFRTAPRCEISWRAAEQRQLDFQSNAPADRDARHSRSGSGDGGGGEGGRTLTCRTPTRFVDPPRATLAVVPRAGGIRAGSDVDRGPRRPTESASRPGSWI